MVGSLSGAGALPWHRHLDVVEGMQRKPVVSIAARTHCKGEQQQGDIEHSAAALRKPLTPP